MKQWLKVVVLVVSVGCVYMLMTWWGLRKHDARIDRDVRFLQLGRKISLQIRETHKIPQGAEELRMTGWLQDSDWRFFMQNGIAYIAPGTNSPEQTVVLRMRSEGKVFLVVHLNGYMDKEQPSDNRIK